MSHITNIDVRRYGVFSNSAIKKNSGARTKAKQIDLEQIIGHWALSKMQDGHDKLIYIDMNAGRGEYLVDGAPVDGSPVVVTKLFQNLGLDFEHYYFEKNALEQASLAEKLKTQNFDPDKYVILPDNNFTPDLINSLPKGIPVFVYHDPHGVCNNTLIERIAEQDSDLDILVHGQPGSHKRVHGRWGGNNLSMLGDMVKLRKYTYITEPADNKICWTFAYYTNDKNSLVPAILKGADQDEAKQWIKNITTIKHSINNMHTYKTAGSDKSIRLVTKEVNIDLLGTSINVFTDITETHWFSWAEALAFMDISCPKTYTIALGEYINPECQDVALKYNTKLEVVGCFISERLFYKLLLTRAKNDYAKQLQNILCSKILLNLRNAGSFTITDQNYSTLPLFMTEMIDINNKIAKVSDEQESKLVVKPVENTETLTAPPAQELTSVPVVADSEIKSVIINNDNNMKNNQTNAPKANVDEVDRIINEAGCFNTVKDTNKTRNIIRAVIQAGPEGILLDAVCKLYDYVAPEVSGWDNTRFPIAKVAAGGKKKKFVWQGKFPATSTTTPTAVTALPIPAAATTAAVPSIPKPNGVGHITGTPTTAAAAPKSFPPRDVVVED